MQSLLKLPPHSVEAEQGVIGALMIGADFVPVSAEVSSVDFYMPQHKAVFGALGNLFAKGLPADLITVSEWLEQRKELDNVGGLAYLAELAKNTPSISNAVTYARIVKDKSTQRRLLQTAHEIAASVYGEQTTEQKIAFAQSLIMSVDGSMAENETRRIQDYVDEMIADMHDPVPADPGFKTGYPDMDKILVGLERGCVHILAARPSTGKTMLALNIVENMANDGASILIFSLEMKAKSLARRVISSMGRFPGMALRNKEMDDHWDKFASACHRMKNKKIFINETSGMGIEKIKSIARFQKKVNNIDVIFIDYLGLIKREKSNKSTSDEVGHISNEIKNMAKELNVAVVLLCQLNRGIENRSEKMPSMSDLRSSGDIEQDAETITFLYRPVASKDGVTTVTIAKNRDGETGQCSLVLKGAISRFESCASYDHTPSDTGKKSWADKY